MATIDYIHFLVENGRLKDDYTAYRHLVGKTKYKVKGK